MGQLESLVVSSFKGIHRPGNTPYTSDRRVLDEPKEMYNFHLTELGYLYMPPVPNEVLHDFSADGEIISLNYMESPKGVIVQMDNGKIFHLGIESSGAFVALPTLLATISVGEREWPLWVNSTIAGYSLMGYAPRNTTGPAEDGVTWKVTGTPSAPVAASLNGDGVVAASDSQLFKGRRIWVKRGRDVFFTTLNSYDQPHDPNDTFVISGDDAGDNYLNNPGFVQGMVSWEDVLILFLSSSVWILTGADPNSWNLRQVETIIGNQNAKTLVRTDSGVLGMGGHLISNRGVYLFTGSQSRKVSRVIDHWLIDKVNPVYATMSDNKYILSVMGSDPDERQFLLMDIDSQQWYAFDGWINGICLAIDAQRLMLSSEGVLYNTFPRRLPRKSGRGARIILGYHDEENPTGLNRYLGLKISGKFFGTGQPTVIVTAKTPDTTVVSDSINVPSNVFDSLVIPLNIRGAAIEFEIAFTPDDDDNELLIENLQVIRSKKAEKVSRG